mmetsp:Transcript_17819/g.39062  ORF Transcript_17819/g.39062 Transcript_17819/m.39062 type:complete len:488 (-) Transcript_17819:181-1644(-)|eukprot:CAMPEP_0170578260 /NCGR_PEP_ID=MMETSP0224-20130122/5362_1 /TAXON_ID=285029 /ORGANISM="Togula jolla, Strain CCCM 725" /LENGTH=487 /DNA_ID=CAMNT_0010901219 /DNA_START=11 /DNA_END=1474 /DNA_ORIENTATION=-
MADTHHWSEAPAFITGSQVDPAELSRLDTDVDLQDENILAVQVKREPESEDTDRLLQEAELRAEHQAAARQTMLELARALHEASLRQSDLCRKLQEEQDRNQRLRNRCGDLEDELDAWTIEEDKRKAEKILERGFTVGNRHFIKMMLEKSKEAYPHHLFAHDKEEEEPEEEEEERAEGEEVNEAKEKLALTAADLANASSGDRIKFGLIFRLWMREVTKKKERLAAERAEEERRRLEEEKRRKALEEMELRSLLASLQQQLNDANHALAQQRERMVKLEALASQEEALERQHRLEQERLHGELALCQAKIAELNAQILSGRDELLSLRQSETKHAVERRQLQEMIRTLSSDLQQALAMAKYMKEALKVKRDTPGKFAQLIAQLEELRDQVGDLRRDLGSEKDHSVDLQAKLEKNQRRLELERQFLPLVRQARGPLGPKVGVAIERRRDISSPVSTQDETGDGTRTLPRSQSLSSRRGIGLGAAFGGS